MFGSNFLGGAEVYEMPLESAEVTTYLFRADPEGDFHAAGRFWKAVSKHDTLPYDQAKSFMAAMAQEFSGRGYTATIIEDEFGWLQFLIEHQAGSFLIAALPAETAK
jgi:hypothetical protein